MEKRGRSIQFAFEKKMLVQSVQAFTLNWVVLTAGIYFSRFWRWEVQGQGAGIQCLVRTTSWLVDSCLSLCAHMAFSQCMLL